MCVARLRDERWVGNTAGITPWATITETVKSVVCCFYGKEMTMSKPKNACILLYTFRVILRKR